MFILRRETISLGVIGEAMTGLTAGKTPGSDGVPQEFYAKFWDLFGFKYIVLVSKKAILVNPCRKV